MCALRSSSMIFTENRNSLRPVKTNSKSNIPDDTKRNMLLRAKKLSLDSDSLMKSLLGKYEEKESKPPPVVGLGVRRYKGSKSYLGPGREADEEGGPPNKMEVRRKKSTVSSDSHMSKIQEESAANVVEDSVAEEYVEAPTLEAVEKEAAAQEQIQAKLVEVAKEMEEVLLSLAEDNLDLNSDNDSSISFANNETEAAINGDIDVLKRALRNGCDVNKADEDGETLLQLACNGGHTLAVRLLAANGE